MTKTPKAAHETTHVPPVAPNIEIPAVARELVQRAAKSAEARVESLNAGVEKATDTLESAFGSTATTFAEASRALQGAVYADVKAAIALVEKLAESANLADAAKVQVEFFNARGQVGLERVKAATEYFAKAMQTGAKATEHAIAKFAPGANKAA